ncbi:TetR/AcrR family transcriptional regulator [Nonomuraea fastidiosa]|jgi:AcrR family transcriptional regulator|uniref:TetR/AcrR family transcriptional regulator n=1 Tax=Nonomuraea TaxID=83681 RepID=UPI00324662DD
MDSPDGERRELILRTATRLFAGLGYDVTSMAQIAEAAGLDPAQVAAHFPAKRELYVEVMQRAREILAGPLQARADAVGAAPPEHKAEALRALIDAYIDGCVNHPEVAALWAHRWLSDASDVVDLELKGAQPLTQHIVDSIATVAGPAGADALHTTYTMIWCIHGFALSGVLDGTGTRRGVEDHEQLRRFRAHLHQLLQRGLRLPEPVS